MKVITIDIDKAKAIFCALRRDKLGQIKVIKSDFKFAILKDDKDSAGLRDFQWSIHAYFDMIKPDRIVILARQMKGRFKAASVSFKIEALLQTYLSVDIEFISPQTVKAFYKKHDFDEIIEHAYQENALKLGYYLLNQHK